MKILPMEKVGRLHSREAHSLVFLLFLSFYESNFVPSSALVPVEQDVLLEIKNAWTDPGSVLSSWTQGNDCSNWNGITCDENGHVKKLDLQNKQLSGPLPPSIGELTYLSSLYLNENLLNGPLPSSIGNLKKLVYLHLEKNSLDGTLPSSIGDLINLWELALYTNQFSGPLPPSIGKLTNLFWLLISDNKFSGSIPSTFANLVNVNYLLLYNNQFSGPIPLFLGAYKNIRFLNLQDNKFSGPIPPSIGKLNDLGIINLRNNSLTGPIPDSFSSFKKLTYLDLSYNKIDGSFPPSFLTLNNIQQLYLTDNLFNGPLPSSIGNLNNLVSLYLNGNVFDGPLPSSIGNLINLDRLDLSGNQFSGPIPSSIGKLTKLKNLALYNNQFSGPLPPSIGMLTNLNWLLLSANKFSGSIPTSFANLVNVDLLWLFHNQLSGPIPPFLGALKSIKLLYMDWNYFTGNSIECKKEITLESSCNQKFNCLKGITNQRSDEECTSFCGANSASGPCGGHGNCAFNAQYKPVCACDAGWVPPNCQKKISPPDSQSPSPPDSQSPSPPSNNGIYNTWLIPQPVNMTKRNPYFRYASYRFTGTEKEPNWDLTADIDWRKYSTPPIEDQGTCNACWAMAPAASVERLLPIANYGLKIISKQQILDCQGKNKTCGGGWPTDAFEYMATHGVAKVEDYPWESGNQQCNPKSSDSMYKDVKIAMYEEVDYYGSFGLILAVQNQPVVVNIQSSSSVFKNYNSGDGVMDKEECFTDVVDHTVVVMGYSIFKDSKPYWIIRNSWGTSWGEMGYMKLAYTGGLGICGIHSTPAYYPVLPIMFENAVGSKYPCRKPDPCGGGKCSIDSKTKLNKCSNCPPSFTVVKNLDNTESCVPKQICELKSSNPCGFGACVNDKKGGYTCICPRGYSQTTFSDLEQYTCIEASSIAKGLPYTVQAEDTCSLIALSFGLSNQQLQKQNKQIDCNKLIPGQTKIDVTQSSNWTGCAVKYSWNKGDTCPNIASFLNIGVRDRVRVSDLMKLNPALDCNEVIKGSQICVKSGTPPIKTPPCGKQYPIESTDTCASIVKKFKLDPFFFLLFNPGINCLSLVPQNSKPVLGQVVCVDAAEPFGSARRKCTGRTYYIRKSDTCSRIISRYFKTVKAFKMKNFGSSCVGRRLKIGETICL